MNQKKETGQPTPLVRQDGSETMPDPKENDITPAEENEEHTSQQAEDEELQTQVQRGND